MSGGGSIPQPDPIAEARAQILILQEQEKIAQQNRLFQLQQDETKATEQRSRFDTSIESATSAATQRALAGVGDRGLNPDDFANQIANEVASQRQGVPFLAENPSSFFAPDIADIVLNREQSNQQRGFTRDIQAFAPTGFADTLLPGTADDAVLQAILQEQFAPASQQVLAAFNRGSLTQQGFDSANQSLTGQRSAADARLQDVGGGVLGDIRTQLRGIADEGFAGAGNFQLGNTFDPGSFETRINNTFADLSGRLEGSVRNSLGGEQLFNIEDVLTRAGIAQGPQNLSLSTSKDPTVLSALADRDKSRSKSRGLGSEGVF